MLCRQNFLYNRGKIVAVDLVQRHADFFHIRVQYGTQDILIPQPVCCNLHTLYSGQLVADHLLKCTL